MGLTDRAGFYYSGFLLSELHSRNKKVFLSGGHWWMPSEKLILSLFGNAHPAKHDIGARSQLKSEF